MKHPFNFHWSSRFESDQFSREIPFALGSLRSPQRALPTETKVESGTSRSKSGTSVKLKNSEKQLGSVLGASDIHSRGPCVRTPSIFPEREERNKRKRGRARQRETETSSISLRALFDRGQRVTSFPPSSQSPPAGDSVSDLFLVEQVTV